MTEPHEIITVSRRLLGRRDKPRTLAEYQANIIARFGRLPSWPELAKLEGPAHNRFNYAQRPAELSPRMIAQKAAQAAKTAATGQSIINAMTKPMTAATGQSIINAMTKPMTAADIAHAVKLEPYLVRRYLVRLAAKGRIVGHKVKKITVWQRVAA